MNRPQIAPPCDDAYIMRCEECGVECEELDAGVCPECLDEATVLGD